jgi:uncharacterized protein (TIGR02594 family)
MDSLLKIATNELGQKEIKGAADNPVIVNYSKEAGFDWVNDDETPWCSIFVNWCAKKAELKGSGKANARSWLRIGTKVDESPEPGDVVIFWRGSPDSWKGHVGFFLGFSKDLSRVYTLGGNQGNQVSISAYSSSSVLGYRRLSSSSIPVIPNKILKLGDQGDDVKALQNALKMADFNCGTSDGDFGGKTDNAVKALQSNSGNLKIDGVFGSKTRDFLIELLQQ